MQGLMVSVLTPIALEYFGQSLQAAISMEDLSV
jgi:hypothetical protein